MSLLAASNEHQRRCSRVPTQLIQRVSVSQEVRESRRSGNVRVRNRILTASLFG